MKSQEGFTPNAATALSSTPTHGVRKIVICLKTPTNTNTMILNGETSSCISNAEKKNGKRVLDMECKNEFQENIKKAKRQIDVASTSNALYSPAATRKNCVSQKFLNKHMILHADKDWKTFIRSLNIHNVNKSGENHNHDAKVVDLSKCLFGWDVKTGKRGRLGSTVADVKREEEAAKCLMCLDDPVTPPMVESGAQVEELMTTSMTDRNLQVEELAYNGRVKEVHGFDINELPACGDVSLTE
uniref:Uncharacterized protein n=1 Tax=Tanacetum cinerariifolium TaxID=118510 RepID=A0A6L2L2Z6_TANCI|nr:hypothetical protein [Tanacetum cinerariifolium]